MSSPLNALNVPDQPMLLTRTATGTAIHLTAEATATDGRAATPDRVKRVLGEGADKLARSSGPFTSGDRWCVRVSC